MNLLAKTFVTLFAAAVALAITSLIVLPLLPLRDLAALVGFLFWLGTPVVVLCITPSTWDSFVARRRSRRYAREAQVRAAREEEELRFYEAQQRDAELTKQKEEAAREKREEQQQLVKKATELLVSSKRIVGGLPEIARQANDALDLAEQEFAERVFVPFWEAIGIAASLLSLFNRNVETVIANRKQYHLLGSKIQQAPAGFAISLNVVPDATGIAERMAKIARQAHKDPEFALVFGPWKTNELLVVGFSSLQDAIWNLSSRLAGSISNLNSSLGDTLSQLASEQREEGRLARESAERQAERAMEMATELAAAIDEQSREEQKLLEEIRDQAKRRG